MADIRSNLTNIADNINVGGSAGDNTFITDFGGNDTYTILAGLAGNVTITDNDASTINMPTGLTIDAVSFAAAGVQFTVNGFTVTILGDPANFNFVFGGTPLDPTAGTPRTYDEMAASFGTTVPAADAAANAGTAGDVNADGTVGGTTGGTSEFSITAVSVAEGDTGTTNLDVVIARTGDATTGAATVDLNTTDGIATVADNDYVANATAGISFAEGELTKTVTISVTGDTTVEVDETFNAVLSNATGASTISGTAGSATLTITDDDERTFTLTSDADSVLEDINATFTVTASGAVAEDTVVTFNVAVGDAAAEDQGTSNTNLDDFASGTFNPTTATILAGETTVTFGVKGATDGITELPESYTITADVAGSSTQLTKAVTLLDLPNTTFTLTVGTDNGAAFIGTSADETFDATTTVDTFTSFDEIDGGDGDDVLNVRGSMTTLPSLSKVLNIEEVNFSTTGTGFTGDFTGYTGLTTLTVAGTGIGAVGVTASDTTDVTISGSGNGNNTVTGGKVINVLANVASDITVTTSGSTSGQTSVTTSGGKDIAIGSNNPTTDTITTASVTKFAGSAAINSNVLTTLTTADNAKVVTVTADAATRELTVGTDKLATGSGIVDDTATTLTINNTGNASTLSTIAAAAATTINISAAATPDTNGVSLTVSDMDDNDNVATALNLTGAGKIVIDSVLEAALVTVNAGGNTGGVSIKLDTASNNIQFTGSTGDDTVTTGVAFASGSTAVINAGAGDADKLVIGTTGDVNSSTLGARYTNFEIASVTDAVALDMDNLSGITSVMMADDSGSTSITDMTAAQAAAITISVYDGAVALGIKDADTVGQLDAVTVTFDNGNSTTSETIESSNQLVLTLADIETLNIVAVDDVDLEQTATASGDLSATNISGAGDVRYFTGDQATINHTIDASTATGTIIIDADAYLTNGVAIKGGTKENTLTGSDFADNITGGALIDTIDGGTGIDTIDGGDGVNTITGGTGDDKITLGSGVDTVIYNVVDSTTVNGSATETVAGYTLGTDILSFDTTGDGAVTGDAALVADLTNQFVGGMATGTLAATIAADTTLANAVAEFLAASGWDNNDVGGFIWDSNTYIVHADADNAAGNLVQLTGISGASIAEVTILDTFIVA